MRRIRMCKDGHTACDSNMGMCFAKSCRHAVAVYANEWRAMQNVIEAAKRVIACKNLPMVYSETHKANAWLIEALLKLKKARVK